MAIRTLAVTAGLMTGAAVLAVPAQAEGPEDAFISAVSQAGIGAQDPASTIALGQSICPMLSEPGQTTADVAGKVADTAGIPFSSATMFTGIAISMFCPAAISSIGTGQGLPALPFLPF
jgi:hypothetical protein